MQALRHLHAFAFTAVASLSILNLPLTAQSSNAFVPSHETTLHQATALATLTTDDGRTIYFIQPAHGGIIVAETGPISVKPKLDQHITQQSLSKTYQELSSNAAVPFAIEAAEAEMQPAAEAHIAAIATAPPKKETAVSSLSAISVNAVSTLTPTQSWFQSTFCSQNYTAYCDLGTGSQNTSLFQWTFAPNAYAYSVNDSSNTSPANMYEYVWNGSSWQFDWASPSINPGFYWNEFWWNSSAVFRAADLVVHGPGGLGQGSATPSCAASYLNLQNGDLGGEWLAQEWSFQATGFQNDPDVRVTVGPVFVAYVPTTGISSGAIHEGGLNVTDATCADQAWYNSTPWTVQCVGTKTGQVATTTVLAPFFAPANCCASRGGGKASC